MNIRIASGLALLCLASVAACSHSEPFPTEPSLEDGPLTDAPPIRLTYSVEDDGWPVYSLTGAWLSYRFERGLSDRDFCAGAIPGVGGQRVAEVCAWDVAERNRADDFRSLVLLGNDQMAFTWHSSGVGNQAPNDGGLYVAPVGVEEESRLVLDLMVQPPGASAIWTYLIDPILIDDNQLLVLASQVFIGQPVAFGPVDTVYLGVEIARINLSSTPATVTSIVAAPNAVAWTLDQGAGMLYFHRRYYTSPPGGGPFSIAADTIFRVPLAGGTPEVVFGRPPAGPDLINTSLDGFAVSNGRLFVALSSLRQPTPPPAQPPETRSELLEVQADGTTSSSYIMVSNSGNRWMRLAAAPDGRHLVAESVISGAKDLQLLEIDP